MQNKWSSILLLFTLLTPVVGTLSWLQYNTYRVKKAVKRAIINGMDQDELTLIKITPESRHLLRWEHSREFEYRSQMYDIVSVEKHGDTTFYWCWWDREETYLNQKITEVLDYVLNTTQERNQHKQHLLDFYKSLICQHVYNYGNIFIGITDNFRRNCFRLNFCFQSIILNVLSPPPEI